MTDNPTEVENTRLTLSLGATISVGTRSDWNDWVRPSASYSIQWKGIPSEDQIRLATTFIQTQVLNPVLEEIIVESQKKLDYARRQR